MDSTRTGWGVSSCTPSNFISAKDLAPLNFSHLRSFSTPDKALAEARAYARLNPECAVKVTCGPAPRFLILRGELWGVRPDGGVESLT